ncbi:NAD(+) synthase [Candidatus Saccharibacteria bacterium]|nr:NAD(+) synthase [Candidatus Saccharibacteria bacterium]
MNNLGKNFEITAKNVQTYIEEISEWIFHFLSDSHRNGAVFGLSGGVDSAVVARLVQTSGMPFTALLMPNGDGVYCRQPNDFTDAKDLVMTFGFDYRVIDISVICTATTLLASDPIVQAARVNDQKLARINIAPRIRADILYQIGQLQRRSVIGTSNLSEIVTGYFTKYGDNAYDLNPLGFMTKREVYILAKALGIPARIIAKPPSAGLYEGQTDETELGFSYDNVDDWILYGSSGDSGIDAKIKARFALSAHKRTSPSIFIG